MKTNGYLFAPGLWHRRACTVSMADGHAEIWPMVEQTTGEAAIRAMGPTDRDLQRFYAAIPRRIPVRP